MTYSEFLTAKAQLGGFHGFDPIFMPNALFPFQASLIDWSVRKGRAAIFADCGMGKTLMQLVWAENVARHTGGRVLIATPLAVSHQTVDEAHKFGIEAKRSILGKAEASITVTNYERLHYFDTRDFVGMVLDESSILKNYNGKRRGEITEFMRRLPYRLLCTATAAPNDYTELGTSSEALGELGHMDMLGRFFKNLQHTINPMRYTGHGYPRHAPVEHTDKWRLKGHAEQPFWRWVSSWARALRKPSDLGFKDDEFILPPLSECSHEVRARRLADGALFELPANGLDEQREERKRTLSERCERVAELVNGSTQPALVWCQLNDEGDLLKRLIPDAEQVAGGDADEIKEERLLAFANGQTRVLVTKPKIGAWGLNFQHCAHITYFPSHSYEQYYQAIRRCWRFGQRREVCVDVISTEGDGEVFKNMRRKALQADQMFANLTRHMQEAISLNRSDMFSLSQEVPSWL